MVKANEPGDRRKIQNYIENGHTPEKARSEFRRKPFQRVPERKERKVQQKEPKTREKKAQQKEPKAKEKKAQQDEKIKTKDKDKPYPKEKMELLLEALMDNLDYINDEIRDINMEIQKEMDRLEELRQKKDKCTEKYQAITEFMALQNERGELKK